MQEKLFSVKNVLLVVALLLMIVAIPVAVQLSSQRTQIKSQAATEADVTFTGTSVKQDANGNFTTTSPDIQVKVTSPFGKASN